MDELVPIVLGTVLGTIIWRRTSGKIRAALSVCAVTLSGAIATLLSGEYLYSWAYILLDIAQAALGLAIGFFLAQRWAAHHRTRERYFP
jgi:hypothetical protein